MHQAGVLIYHYMMHGNTKLKLIIMAKLYQFFQHIFEDLLLKKTGRYQVYDLDFYFYLYLYLAFIFRK